jgi:phage gpG-like protein
MSKLGFDKAIETFRQAKKLAAIEIMRETKLYFGEAFEKEQLGDDKWPEVARRTPGSRFNEKQVVGGTNKASGKRFVVDQGDDYATRKILAGITGRLRYKTERADSSITNYGAVSVMTNPVPYAGYINDGTPYMPARPFMKQTDQLTTIQLDILKTQTGKTWRIQP